MRFRWTIIAIAMILSLYTLFHPGEEGDGWSFSNLKNNISLGLDLQGGIFMQLEVDEQDAVEQYLEEQAGTIKSGLEADTFTIDSSSADLVAETVTLKNVSSTEHEDVVSEIERRFPNWTVTETDKDVVLRLRDVAKRGVQDDAVQQTVYKIQNRVDELGVTEPVINRTIGSNRIVLELAGADDSERVHKIVREPGQLEWRLLSKNSRTDAASEAELLASVGGKVPDGTKIFPYPNPNTGTTGFLLLKEVMLTARNVANVGMTSDDRGLPAVNIVLDRAGGQVMDRESAQNVGNLLAIVLDGKVISAPRIETRLAERFIIQGQFTETEVQDLVVKIKSGSLPAQVRILEERVIGPTLGRDAIQSGSLAAIIGLIMVVIFILIYYRLAGFFAFIALSMNLAIILGLLSGIGAVLTLPGIAGFILTIGMAVDANVLIFERIREELRLGTMPKNAVDIGYKSAFVTIMDANITTFLAAFCLYLLGEGPIRGFAIMLMIGIVSSIFTAVFCSRTFFLAFMGRHADAKTLSIWPLWKSSATASH